MVADLDKDYWARRDIPKPIGSSRPTRSDKINIHRPVMANHLQDNLMRPTTSPTHVGKHQESVAQNPTQMRFKKENRQA
jgi:hypothetical protein